MPPHYFYSYARLDSDPFLDEFVSDLFKEVRLGLGRSGAALVGFRDTRDIERGSQWDSAIVAALMAANVFIPIVSPNYRDSSYCAREFSLFVQRTRGRDPAAPAVVKPVWWIPVDEGSMPEPLRALQLVTGDNNSILNVKGLRFVVKQRTAYQKEYNEYLDQLKDEVVKALLSPALPRLDPIPTLAGTAPAWGVLDDGLVTPSTLTREGYMGVRFVYLALRPEQLPNDRDRAPYQEIGEADWKPYWPDPEAVHPSLQHTVSAPGIRFASGELKFSHDLVTDIRTATKNRQIVVIVVDPWSMYWDDRDPKVGYHAVLHELDRTNDVHWCVVIPWNPQDRLLNEPDLRKAVEDATARAFPYRSGYLGYPKNTAYYRDHISSYEELKKEVLGALHTLKEGIKRTAQITRHLPEGPSHDAISGSGPGA